MANNNNTMIVSEFSGMLENIILIANRHKKLIGKIFAFMFVFGLILAILTPNKYTAVSTLLIQDDQLQVVPDSDDKRPYQRDDLELQTQRELLLSRDLAKQVIKEQGLKIGLGTYTNELDVTGGVRSRVLKVLFEDKDPVLAARIVNAHVDAYMSADITARKAQIDAIKEKADETIETLKQTRAKKSQLAQDLRQDNDLIKGKGDEELIYEQISSISDQIPPIEAKKYAIQSRLDALNNPDTHETVSDIVNSYLIQQLKVEESKKAQEYQLLKSDLGSKNPDLIAAKRAWQSASAAVNNEIENVKRSLENQLIELQNQEDELNVRLKDLGSRANFQQGKMIKLKELELEEEASQKLLDGLLERYEQIQSQASFLQPKAQIVSKATVPDRPSSPNRPLMVILFLFLAGLLSVLSILFLELRDTGIKNFSDIRQLFDREPLGIVPVIPKGMDFRGILNNLGYKEAIRKIVINAFSPHKGQAILITSPRPTEGRSTVTAVLAYYLCLSGSRVLVMDIDSLGKDSPLLGKSNVGGIHDLLRGQGRVQDYIQPLEENLSYLPSGKADFLSSERLLSDHFFNMIKDIQNSYDYVLIDAPPVLAHGGIEIIAANAGYVVLIGEWLKTKPEDLKRTLDILKDSSSKILGVVLNKVDIGRYKTMNSGADFLLPRD